MTRSLRQRTPRENAIRARLVCGVSIAAMVSALGAIPAAAQTMATLHGALGQGGIPVAATAALANPAINSASTAAMAAAESRATAHQAQYLQTQTLAQQAQDAARAAAAALNPNVPDGLIIGGLQPASNLTTAANDPTGLHTWDGASAPTQDATTPGQIDITQTQSQAVLDWTTFNIGAHTTLDFIQQQNGVPQPGWIVLNRVVGQLLPNGLRGAAGNPTEILGSIKADGTVLIIDQNGIIFGAGAQINTYSLIATSLEVGHDLEQVNGVEAPTTLSQRDDEFLSLGLLGYADQNPTAGPDSRYTFSAQAVSDNNGVVTYDPIPEGAVEVAAGASITSASTGFIIMAAPQVINSGELSSPEGQVSLVSGRGILFTRSEGTTTSVDPNLRGLQISNDPLGGSTGDFVINMGPNTPAAGICLTSDECATGMIEAPQGYISLQSTVYGAVLDGGLLASTTSVSRNGYINIQGANIQLSPDSVVAITPDTSPATIPQDPTTISDFKTSDIRIGDTGSSIDIGANSLIYAPSANISIGADPGQGTTTNLQANQPATRVFIDTGVVIDASGVQNVTLPASANSIEISPVTQNTLQDSPTYRSSFLNGATVYIDPRLSGVLPDGVAWIGSPLIPALSYYQQVGVTASQLMTAGGNVTIGAASVSQQANSPGQAPDVIIKSGALIDVSGGWETFQAGEVQTTQLVDSSGQVVDIGSANPEDTYVGIYNGFTATQSRWGISQTFNNPLLSGVRMEGQYTQGYDAGTLTIKSSVVALDGQVYAQAFAGPQQLLGAQAGTAKGTVYGDVRALQAAPSQLPAGGYLNIQALGIDPNGNFTGGGDISVVGSSNYAPLPDDFTYGQTASFDQNGALIIPQRPLSSILPTDRLDVISLNADSINAMGLSQLTLQTTGAITVASDASVTLAAGGAFEALAGRSLTVNGQITVPSGAIDLRTADIIDVQGVGGSTLLPTEATLGSFDITINGVLNAAGRWVNDYNAAPGEQEGSAWLNGGEITLWTAPRIAPADTVASATDTTAPTQSTDISGSILVNSGAILNLTGGGYVTPTGGFNLSARGGSLSLIDETNYFQFADVDAEKVVGFSGLPGAFSAFRVTTIQPLAGGTSIVAINPSQINAHISIADGSILAHGFAGGGTFNLSAPQFTFGDSATTTGTALPLDFFSNTGFASYNISSYGTDLIPNAFTNGLGGYNAVLATQVVTVGSGQTLSLSESMFSPILTSSQISTLQKFATGGDLNSVLTPIVPTDAWDSRAVNLSLGGLIELDVANGGSIIGQAGGVLTVSQLWNQGTIRIPGGAIVQNEVLPNLYSGANASGSQSGVIAVHSLSDVFQTQADGAINEDDTNLLGLKNNSGQLLTNAQVAATDYIYLLGNLNQGEGVRLGAGSVTDLSGEAIINPRATPKGGIPASNYVDGIVIGGGALQLDGASTTGASLFHSVLGVSPYSGAAGSSTPTGVGAADVLNAMADATIDLAGASATFDRPASQTTTLPGQTTTSYAPTLIWSNGGALTLGAGGTFAGAVVEAQGGAPSAVGGTLTVLNPVLVQSDSQITNGALAPDTAQVSANAIQSAGFDTFVAQGRLNTLGNVTLNLRGAFFVTDRPQDGGLNVADGNGDSSSRDAYSPTIGSGGALTINASYVGLIGGFQSLFSPTSQAAQTADNSVTLNAGEIDITGAVRFDQSVGQVNLSSTGDLRLIGVEPWQIVDPAAAGGATVNPSLGGQLAVNGNLTITAGQVYPTTGTSFTISSASRTGLITFDAAAGATPATPYSAGGSLSVEAASIVQDGVIRVPLGSLTLGSTTTSIFAPVATQSLTVGSGSITSVSTDGLVIPYGTTTDQIEWYFAPTNSDPLTAPPPAVLQLTGANLNVASGATIDLKGGGDVYAYEFISGIGGSRDVLNQFNSDPFTGNFINGVGYQYPDGRQVYAIVPSLADTSAAPYDPIYSANYSSLYSAPVSPSLTSGLGKPNISPINPSTYAAATLPSQVGDRVYLNAAPGLAAGWYTLLPAQYALLPGGMRVVQDTSAATPPPGSSSTLIDGTDVVAGYYGVAGSGAYQATPAVFDVQSQSVFRNYSQIALTYGNATFAADAAQNGRAAPALPIDAGRLILAPLTALNLDGNFETTPGTGGRGSEVDISGSALDIVGSSGGATAGNAIVLTTTSLSDLNAASLFLGGVRTDNADGSTSLNVTSNSITVASGATLSAPEIILATTSTSGSAASLTIADGASIVATGTDNNTSIGPYEIVGTTGAGQSAQGGFLRVANGPQRLVVRSSEQPVSPGSVTLGAATLQGTSVEAESSGNLLISPETNLDATNLALGADSVTFAASSRGLSGLVITPTLQAQIAKVSQLTIQSPNALVFQSGAYTFGNLTLDSAGLAGTPGAASVNINAGTLTLANTDGNSPLCGASGAPACGSGSLAISATQLVFGTGPLRTYGFGSSVTIQASQGILADGAATVDFGPATLTLNTPFIGDRGTGVAGATLPSLSLTTTGAVTITGASGFTAPAGTPGSSLSITGQTVAINDATLRATAGDLTIKAADGITVTKGAQLETPGYLKTFGDSADSVSQSAPAGQLSLISTTGDISVDSTSQLSIYGGQGQAGALVLSAPGGAANIAAGSVDAGPAGSGASLQLDTLKSFDLTAFVTGQGASGALVGSAFSGNVSITTGSGPLDLAAGDTLKATNVALVANGGSVSIEGTIDVSGVNGGNVDLYGEDGVHLASGSKILALADGYGATDTRQATGGNVTLGVDGTGAINVDQGALINVGLSPNDPNSVNRLAPEDGSNTTAYTYVAADQGGTVTFRAPVIQQSGGDTVAVAVQGGVNGANSIVLEGFQSWNLATVASESQYTGVSIVNGQAVLSLAAAGAGQANFLADNAPGTLVQFIQNFNISADYGNLSGLASQANFHARPGVELDYSGDIVLGTNWNLGAGVVNVAAATAAGLMAPVPGQPGESYIIPGDEAAVFAHYTTLTYRVGGSVTGEPGMLTLRAGGNLDLNGSITDGFFQFHDQTNPNYLNVALGGGSPVEQGYLTPSCAIGACSDIPYYSNSNTSPNNEVLIAFPGQTSGGVAGLSAQIQNPVPYSAAANAPDALGSLPGGTGDALGSAQLFPLIPTAGGGTTAVSSWSYQLVGGADLIAAAGRPSVNPLDVLAGSNGSVVVAGQNVYSYQATAGTPTYADSLLLGLTNNTTGAVTTLTADQWYQAFLAQNQGNGLKPNAYTVVDFSSAPLSVQNSLNAIVNSYFANKPHSQWSSYGTGVTTTLSLAEGFMAAVSTDFASIASEYRLPREIFPQQPIYATAPTLVRTGTGDIEVAASQDINLANGNVAKRLTLQGQLVEARPGQAQLGGTAIYTAGHLADLGLSTATDVATGQLIQVDLAANEITTDNFAVPPANGYGYGALFQGSASGYAGIMIANPVYAEGGGSVSLDAGGNVLGRRDTELESELGGLSSNSPVQAYSWIGNGSQPWMTGYIGPIVNGQINPQLFKEGVGTLAGGYISIAADGNVSDLSVVATASLTTASQSGSSQQPLSALVTLGGGNIDIGAQNLLGGRIDAASGEVDIALRGSIASAGTVTIDGLFGPQPLDNTLRLRLTDATVNITAQGDVTLQGIGALGITVADSSQTTANLDAQGFYSPNAGVSIVADGAVNIQNTGEDLLTTSSTTTGDTQSAVYPGSLEAASLTGNLDIVTTRSNQFDVASATLLYPSPTGTLRLLAAGNIEPLTIAMEDADPNLLPGAFTSFAASPGGGVVLSGLTFDFPSILPNTTDVVREALHNENPTHEGDPNPNYIVAGGSIYNLIFNSPKQARISAGLDLINTVFVGQNLSPLDITRITAGRDIVGTTSLVSPIELLNGSVGTGPELPTVQGNTFVIGGPGSFFLEAGRDAGPFLNSAVTNGYEFVSPSYVPTGTLTYAGGIQSVGNLYNPWLQPVGASILTAFGVSKGENFDGLRDYYLDPANFASLPDYLFQQTTSDTGLPVVNRNVEIYQSTLISWLQSIAPQIVAQYNHLVATSPPGTVTPTVLDTVALALVSGQTVDYSQAYQAFTTLPELNQRVFLLKYVYFNELVQTSLPSSPSYHQYSRGYVAVNTLFPASDGYTQNNLTGTGNGSNTPVLTGNLDLRLSTIQTDQGGDIYILGPGGEVLAGSTVATATQAQRRDYEGGILYSGDPSDQSSPFYEASTISSIPVGYEGILTLQGGDIDGFTDGDFLLNQSRLFTEGGGNIALWSSNANLNAGQGPKNSANFPPIAVSIDDNAYSTVDQAAGVSGAGIAAFQPDPNAPAPDVFLIAPRGTVDAGAAGVRSAGNIFVAALQVSNATNFQTSTGGSISGVASGPAVNVSAGTSAGAASAAAAQAAQAASNAGGGTVDRTVITVDVLGYLAGLSDSCDEDQKKKGKCD